MAGKGRPPGGQKFGGRVKGQPNNCTKTLRELARVHTDAALKTLVQIATLGESEAAKVAAANALLDRGYGKPSTVVSGDEEGGPLRIEQVGWNVRDT